MTTPAIIAVELNDGSYLASTIADGGGGPALVTTLKKQFGSQEAAYHLASLGDIKAIAADGGITWSPHGGKPMTYENIGALREGKAADTHHVHVYHADGRGWDHQMDDEGQWQRARADLARDDGGWRRAPSNPREFASAPPPAPTATGAQPAERAITFEGTDLSDLFRREPSFGADLLLPGDHVRVNEGASGAHRARLHERLGGEPLEVSRTIARGEERKDEDGHQYTAVVTEYEFKGVEGRFTSQYFQHERGEHSLHGAMLAKDGRLWLVPLREQPRDPAIAGPAREVTSVDWRASSFPEWAQGPLPANGSLADARDRLAKGGVVGEFTVRPKDLGPNTGPVELVSTTGLTTANKVEERWARAAVEKAEAAGGAPSRIAIQTAMAAAGVGR